VTNLVCSNSPYIYMEKEERGEEEWQRREQGGGRQSRGRGEEEGQREQGGGEEGRGRNGQCWSWRRSASGTLT